MVEASELEKLTEELKRVKRLAPFRIVWGYIENGEIFAYAAKDKRQMNKAVRENKTVYTI